VIEVAVRRVPMAVPSDSGWMNEECNRVMRERGSYRRAMLSSRWKGRPAVGEVERGRIDIYDQERIHCPSMKASRDRLSAE